MVLSVSGADDLVRAQDRRRTHGRMIETQGQGRWPTIHSLAPGALLFLDGGDETASNRLEAGAAEPLDGTGKSRDHRGIIRRDRRATTQDASSSRGGRREEEALSMPKRVAVIDVSHWHSTYDAAY